MIVSPHDHTTWVQFCWSRNWTCKRTWYQNYQVQVQAQQKGFKYKSRLEYYKSTTFGFCLTSLFFQTLFQWCSPRDEGLGLEASRGQKWKSWFWIMKSCMVLVLNIWSWSRSWRKSLGSFSRLVVILDGSEQGTPWHFVRDNKNSLPFGSHCLREPSALHAVERVFNNGGYLLGHTDTSKAQCIDCGKLLSLGSNKPGKQTFHGLKCHLENATNISRLYTVHEESGIPSTTTTCKKSETGRGIGGAL